MPSALLQHSCPLEPEGKCVLCPCHLTKNSFSHFLYAKLVFIYQHLRELLVTGAVTKMHTGGYACASQRVHAPEALAALHQEQAA